MHATISIIYVVCGLIVHLRDRHRTHHSSGCMPHTRLCPSRYSSLVLVIRLTLLCSVNVPNLEANRVDIYLVALVNSVLAQFASQMPHVTS